MKTAKVFSIVFVLLLVCIGIVNGADEKYAALIVGDWKWSSDEVMTEMNFLPSFSEKNEGAVNVSICIINGDTCNSVFKEKISYKIMGDTLLMSYKEKWGRSRIININGEELALTELNDFTGEDIKSATPVIYKKSNFH